MCRLDWKTNIADRMWSRRRTWQRQINRETIERRKTEAHAAGMDKETRRPVFRRSCDGLNSVEAGDFAAQSERLGRGRYGRPRPSTAGRAGGCMPR